MDLRDPAVGLFGRFEAVALRALYRHRLEGIGVLTIRDVHRMAGIGAYESIRRALRRLESFGIVGAQELPAGRVYRLNREHLGYSVLEAAMQMPAHLAQKMTAHLKRWPRRVGHASIVGSFARGWYGDLRPTLHHASFGPESETVDLFVVYAQDEWTHANAGHANAGHANAGHGNPGRIDSAEEPRLAYDGPSYARDAPLREAVRTAIGDLEDAVHAWTGNRLIVHDFEVVDLRQAVEAGHPPQVLDEVREAYVTLMGSTPYAFRARSRRRTFGPTRRAESDLAGRAGHPRTG
ncbi:MAG: hypothetical protein R6W77_13865 [Trueperaceae bacterium]